MAEMNSSLISSVENYNAEVEAVLPDEDLITNFPLDSADILQPFKEITVKFEKLLLKLKPQDSDNENEVGQKEVNAFCDLHRLWQNQVANLIVNQNVQVKKLILEKDQLRQKCLADLKNQEDIHLLEIQKLKNHLKIDFANQTIIQNMKQMLEVYEMRQEILADLETIWKMQAEDIQKQILEKDQMRQRLLADLESQEQNHFLEIEEIKQQFKTELEAKDKICLELEEQIDRERGEHELSVSCSICLDPWTLSGHHRLVSLSCGHLFGDPCIRSCLAQQQICPQCRAHASVNDIRYLYGRPL